MASIAALAPSRADPALRPGLVIAAAVAVLALPGAVLALATQAGEALPADGLAAQSGGDDAAARLARAFAAGPLSPGSLFHFTPAGLARRPERSVTVAVRVDKETSQPIIVHAQRLLPTSAPVMALGTSQLRIAPSGYNLGVAREIAAAPASFSLPNEPRRGEPPELSSFSLHAGPPGTPARLAPHIELGSAERPGRAPRTFETGGEQTVDVGGSYRLGRNLDVTAGVRYSQDRDRLPSVAAPHQDSQAVFVGTQFKF